MRTIRFVVLAAAVPALLSLAACEDPAKDKPKATVAPASSAQAEAKPANAAAVQETLDVDATASSVGFIGSKVTGKHEGKFEKLAGKITLADGKAEGGKISFEVETASVKTDAADLDKHLKNADFFDVEKFPKSTFTSTEIKAGGTNGATHTVTGDLDLHGVKKSITFPVTITIAPDAATGTAEFSINRKDFNITIAGKPDDLIRDDVLLKLTLKAPRKKG
ncbi:YceI family protein [Polyangium jinanense]|uniref:YceI family protein n=1 Tax=Polyangium jinanense TaxID=2829994 RepID=A0A9X4ASF6_9BACT|nr:YceI family protein [Polyangium jinanense]MDC3955088.1 YceI family protein [Polyangium jinanense]MDC3981142.1 YceI family protein [Polyangium jinanense]